MLLYTSPDFATAPATHGTLRPSDSSPSFWRIPKSYFGWFENPRQLKFLLKSGRRADDVSDFLKPSTPFTSEKKSIEFYLTDGLARLTGLLRTILGISQNTDPCRLLGPRLLEKRNTRGRSGG